MGRKVTRRTNRHQLLRQSTRTRTKQRKDIQSLKKVPEALLPHATSSRKMYSRNEILVCIFAAKNVVKVETPATFDDAVMRELLSRRVRTASRAQLAARDCAWQEERG